MKKVTYTLLLVVVLTFLVFSRLYTSEASLQEYSFDGVRGRALVFRPEGDGPFPVVIFNHGLIVDKKGYADAVKSGYRMDKICKAISDAGFFVFAPIRGSGRKYLADHTKEVSRAIDYVKTRQDVDATRMALLGFSRGGLLTLLAAANRDDFNALLLMAPAPGRGELSSAISRISSSTAPILVMVESEDRPHILAGVTSLERALKKHGNSGKIIRYDRGGGHKLFWDVGYYWDDLIAFLREHL